MHSNLQPSSKRAGGRRGRTRELLVGSLCATLTGLSLGSLPVTPALGVVTDTDPTFEVSASDLRFILKQIKISEAHASDGNLLCASPTDTTGTCVPEASLPWGLRTVSGIHNNLLPGQEHFGAADRPFPRLTPETFRQGSGSIDFDGPAPGSAPPVTGTSYAQLNGPVVDSEPRVISNLIVDQTTSNPAAVAVALETPGAVIPPVGVEGPLFIPNVAPDEGLSAPFNSWFTLFGQFFDHGLDLVNKGGNGTVFVPLNDDDPLVVGADGLPGGGDDLPGHLRFMPLTRATVVGTDANGARQHNNQTTPFVDQNQTYTSHPAHQVFLREYEASPTGPRSTGLMLDGAQGGLATWTETKAAVASRLGIALDDQDVLNVPQVVTDLYGQFVPGPSGFPELVFPLPGGATPAGCRLDGTNMLCSGTPASPFDATGARRTNHAFLDDIAHNAVPDASYDAALLGSHFITGDGRGNENIGLTSVHHVFHAEHNRLANVIDATLDLPENAGLRTLYRSTEATSWGYGARLFQAARFATEMQYQHLVFEEFARTVQPAIDPAAPGASFQTTTNPAIPAEFAHAVYRFGHSMLTDTIARRGFGANNLSLFDGFLNPAAFTQSGTLTPDQGAGSVINGMVAQTGNGIDEFVDETLRNQLLGLPLDLPTINLVRAREAGVPPLQTVRQVFFDQTGNPALRPYADWNDFAAGLKHPQSVLNFIAAYAVDDNPDGTAKTLQARRDEATALMGTPAFMSGSVGLGEIDLWVGGLAEEGAPFGGMLGSTFNHVFERTLENLQNGDRFYYLNRTVGLNMFHQLEANSFVALIHRTTAASNLPANIFASMETDVDGLPTSYDLDLLNPAALPAELTQMTNGTIRYQGGAHIQMHGTEAADRMRSDIGDDALWGYGGADYLEGEAGNDQLIGGHGDDVLTDTFGEEDLKGSKGNDAINAGPGIDLVHGGAGKDFILHGEDGFESFGGQGDDFIRGGSEADEIVANEGNDWLEAGEGGDTLIGDNAALFQDDPYGGHDVLLSGPGFDDLDSEGGDDIIVTDPGTDRHEGMLGFDWVTHKNDPTPANSDLSRTELVPPNVGDLTDRFDMVEGLSGWNGDDVLRGSDSLGAAAVDITDADCLALGRPAGCSGDELTNETMSLITGLPALLGTHDAGFRANSAGNDILIGGAGSDLLEGRGGNDFIDGSAWLDTGLLHNGVKYDSMDQLRANVFADTQTVNPGDISIYREIVSNPVGDGPNTALYTGLAAEYTITDNADGTTTVSHNGGAGVDGVDTLRNIQIIQFASGPPVEIEDVLNTQAGGLVFLSTLTPFAGQPLNADTLGVTDLDGINQATLRVTFQRQVPGPGPTSFVSIAEGTSFTPTAALVGSRLRAVATFTDNKGRLEQVTSSVTEPVRAAPPPPVVPPAANNPAGGHLTISSSGRDRYVVGTDGIVDADGVGALSFRWQFESGGRYVDLAGANGRQLVVVDGLRGLRIRAVVSFVDGRGHGESLTSLGVRVPMTRASAPPILKALSGKRGGRSTAKVRWDYPTSTGGSEIKRFKVVAVEIRRNGRPGDRTSESVGVRTRDLTMRLPRGKYRFQVRAVNDLGRGAAGISRVVRAR